MIKLVQVQIGPRFNSPIGQSVGIADLVSILLSNAVFIAGTILLFFLVFGAIGMISGAGQNNPQRVAQGKAAATAAIIGFIIIFASYWIVQVIEVLTGVEIFDSGL